MSDATLQNLANVLRMAVQTLKGEPTPRDIRDAFDAIGSVASDLEARSLAELPPIDGLPSARVNLRCDHCAYEFFPDGMTLGQQCTSCGVGFLRLDPPFRTESESREIAQRHHMDRVRDHGYGVSLCTCVDCVYYRVHFANPYASGDASRVLGATS